SGCSYFMKTGGYDDSRPSAPEDRGALVLKNDWYGDQAARLVYINQNWSPYDSLWFYYTTQGSELLSYDYFVNLEQIDNTTRFIDPRNMARFRFMPQRPTRNNPEGLPVGIVRNKNYVGFTCAACHTNQINYKGTGIRVDGAPTLANLLAFLTVLEKTIKANLDDADKFDRFSRRILGDFYSEGAKTALRADLGDTLNELSVYNRRNFSDTKDGFARIDAIGRIFNQAIKFTSGDGFSLPPDAPASYPFIWDTPQHDWVQWIGLIPNANVGSLARNAGEVIGVFGKVTVEKQDSMIKKVHGYGSTVEAKNLVELEEWVRRLASPQWPEAILPEIDDAKARQGEALYQRKCVSCHFLINRSDPKRKIRAQMYGVDLVRTDKTAAHNAVTAVAPTGILEGALMPLTTEKFGAKAPVALITRDLSLGVVTRNKEAAIEAAILAKKHGNGIKALPKQGEHPEDTDQNPFASLMSYKARPLNGIWATAPFLHNGSVPTLYDLLLPVKDRPTRFAVGQREFDPVRVGFKSDPNDPNAPFVFETSKHGNSNSGHLYGVNLSEAERWALIEYLKSL
ncbi:MAG: di-heme-cytochrome C peroxidase, partial [Nitrospiria bacterium]